MKILALSYPESNVTMQDLEPHLAAEAQASWDAYLDGSLREAYLCAPGAGPVAALVFEAGSAADVRSLLDTFPLRQEGLARFDIVELGPFAAWAALFATDAMAAPGM